MSTCIGFGACRIRTEIAFVISSVTKKEARNGFRGLFIRMSRSEKRIRMSRSEKRKIKTTQCAEKCAIRGRMIQKFKKEFIGQNYRRQKIDDKSVLEGES